MSHPVKFGLFLLPNTIKEATDAAIKAESQGFYSVSVNDHFYSPLGRCTHAPTRMLYRAHGDGNGDE